MIQPVSPPYSTRPRRWVDVAAVAATSRLKRCERPTTPAGGASSGGSSQTRWPFHLGSLRTTRPT
eukprot:7482824-Alexandrium_andersonii.AAC.1